MTQDEIIEMVMQISGCDRPEYHSPALKMFESFAKLVAAKKEAELESQEPVAWVDPATLYQLKIGLEGVHLVYETEMVNSLPLYEKPQGWRDNVAQAYLKGFDEGCKSISAPQRTEPKVCCQQYDTCLEPCTPRGEHLAQRTWVGLTEDDKVLIKHDANFNQFMTAGEYADRVQQLTEARLKDKNT